MHALYVCLICTPYMYDMRRLYDVGLVFLFASYMHALYVCLIYVLTYMPYMCMPYMYALYVCLLCMLYTYVSVLLARSSCLPLISHVPPFFVHFFPTSMNLHVHLSVSVCVYRYVSVSIPMQISSSHTTTPYWRSDGT